MEFLLFSPFLFKKEKTFSLIYFGCIVQTYQDALGVLLGQGNGIAFEEWEELENTFGDRLVMSAASQETEFALCVI